MWSAGEGESHFQGPGGSSLMAWENLFAEGTHERDKQLWNRLLFVQKGDFEKNIRKLIGRQQVLVVEVNVSVDVFTEKHCLVLLASL